MRLAFDVDGVFADFHAAYRRVLADVSGRDLIPAGEQPPCWNYAGTYGYTQEEDTLAWRHIDQSDTFWRDLDALPGAYTFLCKLQRWMTAWEQNEAFFVTARSGVYLKSQTETWLHNHGIRFPSVIVTKAKNKADVCNALGCKLLVEDSSVNVQSLYPLAKTDSTRGILLRKRYNEADVPELKALGVPVIETLDDFWRHA